MHKFIIAALASLFAVNVALAQGAPAPAAQPEAKPAAAAPAKPEAKPAEVVPAPAPAPASGCEAKAAEKKLAGAAKASFVKKCEKDTPVAKAEAKPEAKAAAKADGKTKQQAKMKACNKEAGEKALKGKERKAFMSTCLKG
jgi:hypothetical protein